MRFLLLLILCIALIDLSVHATSPPSLVDLINKQVKLYEGKPPGEPIWDRDGPVPEMQINERGSYRFVHEPVLDIYHAKGENRTGAAVLICPGGGYGALAYEHEGIQIAKWLNDHGITGIILRYRMFPYHHPVPMTDVQRAMQTVRANAANWALDPGRIGVLGFSAGGHLASTASVHVTDAEPDAKDAILRVSSRPDFAVLIYPVITMREWGHPGSRRNLLGTEPSEELTELLSNEEHVDAKTPPTLLVHSKDDEAVPIKNSERYLAALKENGVPGKLLVYNTGGHGYGLGRAADHETAAWPGACISWLATIDVIEHADGE